MAHMDVSLVILSTPLAQKGGSNFAILVVAASEPKQATNRKSPYQDPPSTLYMPYRGTIYPI